MAFTNATKHSSSFTNSNKSSYPSDIAIAGFNVAKFDVAKFDATLISYTNQTKNTADFINLTKH